MKWVVAVVLVALSAVLAPTAAPARAEADAGAPLKIHTTEIVGLLAETYGETALRVSGGTPPYRWAARTSGPPWNGLTLGADGVLRGAPIWGTETTLLVRVFDATGAHADGDVRLHTVYAPIISEPPLPVGYRGTPYHEGLDAVHGLEPYTWRLTAGSLPPGLVLRPPQDGDVGSGAGRVAGTPTAVGSWTFTLSLTDAGGRQVTQEQTLRIAEPTPPTAPEAAPYEAGPNLLGPSGPSFDGGAPLTGKVITPTRDGVVLAPMSFAGTGLVDLHGLLPKGTYTFTSAWVNRVGVGPASPPSDPIQVYTRPGAPSGLSVVRGDRSATVSWTAAEDGGEPVDRYIVDVVDSGGSVAGRTTVLGDVRSATIDKLALGTTYRFRVSSGSLHFSGTTAESAPFVAIGVAGKPTGVTASPRNGAALVRWTPPATTNGAAVTGWIVTPHLGGVAGTPVSVPGSGASTTIPGLANGSSYSFAVRAVNEAGPGPASDPSNVIVPAATAVGPSAPAPGAVAPVSGGATVTWSAPLSDGGSPVTGFVVTPYLGATAQAPRAFASTATTQTVTGLADGSTYTFRVAAVNAAGTGSASDPTEAVTAGAPAAPQARAQTAATSAVVSWTVPASNGAPLTGYVVTPLRNGVEQSATTVSDPAATSVRVPNLDVGQPYTFRVAARNSRGLGAPSAATERIFIGGPTPPASVHATARATSAVLTWAPPGPDDAAVQTYVIYAYQDGSDSAVPKAFIPGPASTHTVTGLTPGSSYRFQFEVFGHAEYGGRGELSAPVVVGRPDAVVAPRALPGNATATIVATPKALDAAPVTSYRITPSVNGVAQPAQTFPGSATSWKVTGLRNGTVHTFRVQAINPHGASAVATTAAMRVGVPRPSIHVKATAGRKQATVSWADSANNGAAIVRYVVTPYRDGVAQPAVAFDARARTRVLTGLRSGSSYTFTVRATNSRGTSEASVPSPAVRVT